MVSRLPGGGAPSRRRVDRGHLRCCERKWLLAAVLPSLARSLLVGAASVLALVLVPVSAPARFSGAAEPTFPNSQIKQRSLQAYDANRPVERVRRWRASTPSAGRRLASAVLLAPGSGSYRARGSVLVRALQLRLAEVGAAPGRIDGRYGSLTERAVGRFQAAHGLRVDGIAGPVTLAALNAPIPVLYPGAGDQQAGGSGSVRSLQRRLAGLGFAPGPIDGRDGPLTIQAVERFQGAHGLQADGIVGVHTWRALRAAGRDAASAPSEAARPQGPARPQGGAGAPACARTAGHARIAGIGGAGAGDDVAQLRARPRSYASR